MDNDSTPTTGEAVLETPAEPTIVEEERVSSVDEEPIETPITPEPTPPTAPLQALDPLAELEKLTALDPRIKESLKVGYLRQKDYTQKTQDIAARAKAADAYDHWSPIISLLEKNPSLANSLFKQNQPATPETEYPDDPQEFAKVLKAEAKAEAIKEMKEELAKDRELVEQQQLLNQEIAESEKLDPRLSTDETFAKQIAGHIKVNYEDDIRTGKISVMDATKKALEAHKAYEESLRQNVLADINDKAKKRTMGIPSGNGSPLTTTPKVGKMDMRQAAQLAEEEINRS